MPLIKYFRFFTILYVLVSAVDIWAKFTANTQLEYIVKPLLMPILWVFFYINANLRSGGKSLFAKLILVALIFSGIGDIMLMLVPLTQTNFLAGLVAFLITHVLYIIAFFQNRNSALPAVIAQKPYIAIPFLAVEAIFLYMSYSNLNDMLIPVTVYTTVIISMVLAAINRYNHTNKISFKYILIGALSFMLSDMCIGINKFYAPFQYASIYIMILYCLGQYLIIIGSIAHNSEQKTGYTSLVKNK